MVDNQTFDFNLYGNSQKDLITLNYNVKYPQISKFNLKNLSVLTVVDLKNDNKKRTSKLKTFCSDNNQTKIFDLDNGISYIRDEKNKLNLRIYIKVCYTYSFLQNYILLNFSSYCVDPEIKRLSKNQIKNILLSKHLKYESYSQIFTCLMNWMRDSKNLKGKLNLLLENILWDKCPVTSIVEFIVKHTLIIERYGMMKLFQDCIDSKVTISYSMFNLNKVQKIIPRLL
jgi:hypothetical protein